MSHLSRRANAMLEHIGRFPRDTPPFVFVACDGPLDVFSALWVALKTWSEVENERVRDEVEEGNLAWWARKHPEHPPFAIVSVREDQAWLTDPQRTTLPPTGMVEITGGYPDPLVNPQEIFTELRVADYLATSPLLLGVRIPVFLAQRSEACFPWATPTGIGCIPVTTGGPRQRVGYVNRKTMKTLRLLQKKGFDVEMVIHMTLNQAVSPELFEESFYNIIQTYMDGNVFLVTNSVMPLPCQA